MDADAFQKAVERLQCQFLCCYPLVGMHWQTLQVNMSWDQQRILIAKTMENSLNVMYPIKLAYQIHFLKRLITLLEGLTGEVHDSAYEILCSLQQRESADASKSYAYKHYQLVAPHSTTFTLRESKNFVAEGTTGLCSWQASLALSDYLLHNPEIVRGKAVMELGAGTGLCGFIASRCCGVRHMMLTDGSAECLTLMREHIHINFPTAVETSEDNFEVEGQKLSVALVPWDSIHEARLEEAIKPDILLGADIIYDEAEVADLVGAIDYVFDLAENRIEMILAATVRNAETLEHFRITMKSRKYIIEYRRVIALENSFLFWDRTTPIEIMYITRILEDPN